MSFVWICKCGEVISDAKYLAYGIGVRASIGCLRETRASIRCPGKKGNCEYWLSDYKRMRGIDDHGRS